MSPTHDSTSDVTRAVLSYFLRHPQAADTLAGVARWRLLEEAVQRTTAETDAALGWLVSAGFLCRVAVTGNAPVYCLAEDRRAEAERFLGLPDGSPQGNSGSAG